MQGAKYIFYNSSSIAAKKNTHFYIVYVHKIVHIHILALFYEIYKYNHAKYQISLCKLA